MVPENAINVFVKYVCDEDSDLEWWLSSSSSDEQEIEELLPNRKKRVRMGNFMKIVSAYSENEFRKHFRLNRTTSDICIEQLETANILSKATFGREKVSARKAFLMTVWYLANQETYRQLSDRFNVTESTAWSIIRKVIDYLVAISASTIKWPNEIEATVIQKQFQARQGMKRIVGAIDGSHILINRTGADQYAYCNRKGTHSIILQGVADSNKRFIDVFVGEPGSLHDSRVLRRSALYSKAMDGTLEFNNRFLLGDSAYPTNLPWLLTPYKDSGYLTNDQKIFNYRHSATRVVIENAFALLKGRFRRLRHFDNRDTKFVVKAVIAACVLHNICIDYGETIDDIELYIEEDEI